MEVEIIEPEDKSIFKGIKKISAETENGWFSILPRHIDCTAIIIPGIVELTTKDESLFIGIIGGVMVKQDQRVRIASGDVTVSGSYDEIAELAEKKFHEMEQREKKYRRVLTKLESELSRRLFQEKNQWKTESL